MAAMLLAASAAANSAAAGTAAPILRVRMTPSLHELALRGSVAGAHRLERPECQQVFTDFVDERGHPLQERLDALGMTGREFLGFMGFYEGTGTGRCVSGGVLAFRSRAAW